MSEAIAGWTFGGIWLTATLWAVLDSEARGRSPIIWGLLTLIFGPFALGAYAITGEHDAIMSPQVRRRTYYFTASFFFLGVVYASLIALLAVALDAGISQEPISSHDARVSIAILLALLVFALPLWLFHWMLALGLVNEDRGEKEQRALFFVLRRYGAVVLVISSLVLIGFGVFLLFTMFAGILGVYEGGRDQFVPVLAFLPLTAALIVYHWFAVFGSAQYRAMAARFETGEGSALQPEPAGPD
jgi:hypothetical protein